MLKAFIDDSIQAGEVLILAGFVSSESQWENFSGEWHKCCLNAGWRNGVFKMREAMGMAKRDPTKLEHIKRHYEIIKKHVQLGIAFALPLKPFKRVSKRFPLIGGNLSRDYYWAVKAIILHLAEYQDGMRMGGPVDFVFDNMAIARQIHEAWDYDLQTTPSEKRTSIGQKPVFQDDEKALPLQAADMWAWYCRKSWLDGSYMKDGAFPIPWGATTDFDVLMMQYDETELVKQFTAACECLADHSNAPALSARTT